MALAALVFVVTLVHALWYAPDGSTYAPAAVAASTPASALAPASDPLRLVIAALHIDAKVQYVGLTAAGNIGTPDNFTDVAWYKDGVVPGQPGSAIIDGHVDNGLGLDGVFKHLSDIQVGDDIEVQTASGTPLQFTVTNVASYPYQNVPPGALFQNSAVPELTLITCEGTWVQSGRTYDHRLVVTATLQHS